MELFAAAGMDYVRRLVDSGKQVFLDMSIRHRGNSQARRFGVASKSGATF